MVVKISTRIGGTPIRTTVFLVRKSSGVSVGESKPNSRNAPSSRQAFSGPIFTQTSRSFVVRMYPWILTAYPPMSRYSTLFELSNFKNSLKSRAIAGITIEGSAEEFQCFEALLDGP